MIRKCRLSPCSTYNPCKYFTYFIILYLDFRSSTVSILNVDFMTMSNDYFLFAALVKNNHNMVGHIIYY